MPENTHINSKEFHAVFMLSKMKSFSVDYYTCGSNKNPHFATTAEEFNRPKTDYKQCGQAQNEILKGYSTAMNFFKKWDVKHLAILTDDEYQELITDMEKLFAKYPFLLKQASEDNFRDFGFCEIKDFSMTVYRPKKKEVEGVRV